MGIETRAAELLGALVLMNMGEIEVYPTVQDQPFLAELESEGYISIRKLGSGKVGLFLTLKGRELINYQVERS